MKKIKLIVCALIVCMSFAGVAEAKSRGGSFKSGFSSQKRSAPKPAPTYTVPAPKEQPKKTAFGSFGTANPKAQQNAAAVPQSQMSKDLNGTAAQSNALKTADTRNKANNTTTESESGWFRSGNQNAAPSNASNAQTFNPAPQTIERRSGGQQTWGQQNNARQSSGLMQGLMWFMVGHTVAQHVNAAPQNSQNQNSQAQSNNRDTGWDNNQQGTQQDTNGENNSMTANGIVPQQEQDVPAVETESFFMKLVRVMLWIALISGVIWVVCKVMSFRHRNVKRSTNYSLGS